MSPAAGGLFPSLVKMNPAIEGTIKEKLKDHKNSHFFLVDGMSKLITHDVRTCQSSVFQCFGFKWQLKINPASKERGDYLGVFLRISDVKSLPSNWEVICRFKASVVSQTKHFDDKSGGTSPAKFSEDHQSLGHVKFISHNDLERYIVDDKAVFGVDIIEVKSKFPVTSICRRMGTANRLRVMEIGREKAKFTWKITQFSSFDGVEHSSYEFTVGPRRWKLEMFPKGNKDGKGNFLSLYLNASDYVSNDTPKEDTLAVYKLRVLDQFQRKHHEIREENMFGYNQSVGKHKFLSLVELHDPRRGFLVKDEIYIGVEFILVGTNENL